MLRGHYPVGQATAASAPVFEVDERGITAPAIDDRLQIGGRLMVAQMLLAL